MDLAPKDEAVIDRKLQYAGECDQPPFLRGFRQRYFLYADDEKEDNDREQKPRGRECNWRQIVEADLYKEPCRAPDEAKCEPDENFLH